ncbi:MAG: bifunctional DNA-formamidopyrimidine glycosylase/DNA-(apurinic or apyrimidinic site) lyase [Chloroflexota bacterium]
MPELPEVETVRRSLVGPLSGRRILALRVTDFPGVIGDEPVLQVAARLAGRVFTRARRRAKYLLLDLDDGSALMVHLRMTGHLEVVPSGAPALRFERLAIVLDDGHDLRFADQRKFGRVLALTAAEVRRLERRFGPEPLGPRFTAGWLETALARRPGKLKSVLLDQEVVAGLGNIYADEALFRSRLHPERPASGLSRKEIASLHRAIRAVLREGVDRRGTTFSSYRDAAGAEGENQFNLRVYGRGGRESCPRCGWPLQRSVVGGRGPSPGPRCPRRPGDRRRNRLPTAPRPASVPDRGRAERRKP